MKKAAKVASAQPLRLFYFPSPSPSAYRPLASAYGLRPPVSAWAFNLGLRPLALLPSALSLNHLFIKLNLTVAAAAVAAAILTAAAAGAAIAIAFG